MASSWQRRDWRGLRSSAGFADTLDPLIADDSRRIHSSKPGMR
jgi:hypothetical protein